MGHWKWGSVVARALNEMNFFFYERQDNSSSRDWEAPFSIVVVMQVLEVSLYLFALLRRTALYVKLPNVCLS